MGSGELEVRGGAAAATPSRLTRPVHFADRVPARLRRREDLVDLVASLLGIGAVWLFGLYATATTQAVTTDVLRLGVVREILLLPITLVEGLVILVAPVTVAAALAIRRRFTELVGTLLTAVAAAAVGTAALVALEHLPRDVTAPLRVSTGYIVDAAGTQVSHTVVALNLVVLVLAAFFTGAGEADTMKSVRWSWIGLWTITFLWVIRSTMTLPAALVSLLLGRALGSAARWFLGFRDMRATGADIVASLLHLGIVPSRILRTDLDTHTVPLDTWLVDMDEAGRLRQTEADLDPASYEVSHRPEADGNRHYRVWDVAGVQVDLTVMDPGRDITGTLVQMWDNLRLRGISRWVAPSVKASAERSTLTALEALRAGVRVPEPVGIIHAGASVLTVARSLPPVVPLAQMAAEDVDDSLVDEVWSQLARAHRAAVAHRNLTLDAVLVDAHGHAWVTDWEQGEVASSGLTRRIDTAQMLTLLALTVGAERALASARRILPTEHLRATVPLLQRAVLPTDVSQAVRRLDGDLLTSLRGMIVEDAAASDEADLLDIQRFAPKSVIMVAVLAVALVTVLGSMNFAEITATVAEADWRWVVTAFALSCLTWVGAAICLLAFSPERLRFRDALTTQVAASIVTVVAPAGVGPAALNLRYLAKQGVATAAAATTVTLQQITQFLAMVGVLVLIVLFTDHSVSVTVPYSTLLAVALVLFALVALVWLVPPLRRFVRAKVAPTWEQVYPRVLWVIGRPDRILAILGGNLVMNIGFIGAFWASLTAMGGSLDLTTLSVTYLASNSLGSVIPSPGGIGPVEAALTGGMQVAGVPLSIALSVALLYRLVTFYGRIPFGWVAMKVMERRGIL